MNTHQLIMPSVNGGQIAVFMTAEQARDAIRHALANTPVQFARQGDQGWEIDHSGSKMWLLKLPPEMMN